MAVITVGADELLESELAAREDELELDETVLTEELLLLIATEELLIELGLLLVATDVLMAELDEVAAIELAELFDPLSPPQALSTKQVTKNGIIF